MKKLIIAILVFGVILILGSCVNKEQPTVEENPVDVPTTLNCEETPEHSDCSQEIDCTVDPSQDKCDEEVDCVENPMHEDCVVIVDCELTPEHEDCIEVIDCELTPNHEECVVVTDTPPVFSGDFYYEFDLTSFDLGLNISCYDAEDGNISRDMFLVRSNVDLYNYGTYEMLFAVYDSDGNYVEQLLTFAVVEPEYQLANGLYNLNLSGYFMKYAFLAATEKYLFETMAGGIPLFTSASYVAYDDRVALPVDEYIPLLGYVSDLSTLTSDDSTVDFMFITGEEGTYTYRKANSYSPNTYNHWLYDTSSDSEYMELYLGSLYQEEINFYKTGYDYVDGMADGDPVGVDSYINEYGKQVSDTWQINIKEDLAWTFHPNVGQGFLDSNPDLEINAHDFVGTYQLALEENWFRAVSGGSGFCNSSFGVVGACEFADLYSEQGYADFESVGIKVVDDYTIEFAFDIEHTMFDVKLWLSSFMFSPINLELYQYYRDALGHDMPNLYGTSNETIGYHGAYYVDTDERDQYVLLKENDNYYGNEYKVDQFLIYVVSDPTTIFNLYMDGYLDETFVPTILPDGITYQDLGAIKVPGASLYTLQVNGLKTEAEQRDKFPNGTWVPEPLLGTVEFNKAMYFAIDREYLANDVLVNRMPAMGYYTDAYTFNPELGTPYRYTEYGRNVLKDLSPSTYGYDSLRSKDYFLTALDIVLEEGYYQVGTEDNYTEIVIDLNTYSNSESWDLTVQYLKSVFEETFIDEERFIKVIFNIEPKDFPAIYYDHTMVGEYDMSVYGVSSNTMCGIRLYSFDSNCGSGIKTVMMNGLDLNEPNIEVSYRDYHSKSKHEIWSYRALVDALFEEVVVYKGKQLEPLQPEIYITSPTSFEIDFGGEEEIFENVYVTVQYYDIDQYDYFDTHFVDVLYTGEPLLVESLNPGFFNDNYSIYRGDYQISITYQISYVEERTFYSTSAWFVLPSTVSTYIDNTDTSNLIYDLTLNENFTEEIENAYLINDSLVRVGTFTVDGLRLSKSNTHSPGIYYIEINYFDGTKDYLRIEIT